MLVAILLACAAAVTWRRPLADWLWPQNRAQALRLQAADALRAGRLTAADGSGARELFDAALAIDPDRSEALEGLQQVGSAALAQADAALRRDDFARAHAALRLARSLSVPRADAERVAAVLRRRETARAGLPALLARADAARAVGHFDGDDAAALPLYARILALQPDNDAALKGREDALGSMLDGARAQLRRGDLAAATAAIATARRFDPGHVDLPDTESRLNEELDDVRRSAAMDLRRDRLEDALRRFRSLQAAGATTDADTGIERVATAYAQRATRLAADFQFADARAALRQARELLPELPALADAERLVDRSRQRQASLEDRLPPRERARRVAQLLAAAAAAEARGDLLLPPGDSAFDKLRAARAIAPDDPDVRRASARLLPTARRCYEDSLAANDLARARACLDARSVVEADDAALADARRRLARRWLAIGDERLGAGDMGGATRALAAARSIDARVAGIDAFASRLRTADAP